jgi:ABC-type multidrug transport system fused ATPase/permease subunit
MGRLVALFFAFVLLLLLPACSYAQRAILLTNRQLPAISLSAASESKWELLTDNSKRQHSSERQFYAVQTLEGGIELQAELRAIATPLGYLPHDSFIVWVNAATQRQLLNRLDVVRVVPLPWADRHAASLSSDAAGPLVVHVPLEGLSSLSDALDALWNADFSVVSFPLNDAVAILKVTPLRPGTVTRFRALLDWLSRRPECLWVEEAPQQHQKQLKSATRVVAYSQRASWTPAAPRFPLAGEGQLIGVADSGLNTDSCFFFDPLKPLPSSTVDLTARKVVVYFPVSGQQDQVEGHGTTCSSAVAGDCSANSTLAQWNGFSSLAKLVFIDIQNDTRAQEDPNLDLPSDLRQIWQLSYGAGARIHSDSWGAGPYNTPTVDTFIIDQFAYTNPDFLMVRAAGNYGPGELITQGLSKNSLVVGATEATYDATVEGWGYRQLSGFKTASASYCASIGQPSSCVTIDQCCSISQLQSSCCVSYQQAQTALTQGPDNLPSYSSQGPTRDGRLKPDLVAPGFITGARSNGFSTGTMFPTTDDKLNLFTTFGTSFATPLVAGAAGVVREYFVKGYYPSGSASAADAIASPPASLLKAVLIAGSTTLNGTAVVAGVRTRLPVASPWLNATYLDGHGRVAVDRMLPLGAGAGFGLQVPVREDRSLNTGQAQTYCYSVGAGAANVTLAVVLAWTDPPASPLSLMQLVNNLDMQVIVSSADGNFLASYNGNGARAISGVGGFDMVNNVEKVFATVAAGQIVSVNITGANVPQGPQTYSLVLLGAPLSPSPTCAAECLPGSAYSCPIENGIGRVNCVDGRNGPCVATSCADGYTLSSIGTGCIRFASFYIILASIGGGLGVIAVLVIMLLSLIFHCRMRKVLESRPPGDVGFWELYAIVHKVWPWSALVCLLSTASSICGLLQPIFVGQLISRLPTATAFSDVQQILYYIIGLLVADFIASTAAGAIAGFTGEWTARQFRRQLFRSLLSQTFERLAQFDKTELQTRLLQDTAGASSWPLSAPIVLSSSVTKLICGSLFMFLISWQLTLVFVVVIPPIVLASWWYSRFLKKNTLQLQQARARTAGTTQDTLVNLRTVKLASTEDKEYDSFVDCTRQAFRLFTINLVMNTILNSMKNLLLQGVAVALLWYGSILVIQPRISVGLLISFFLYVALVTQGVGGLTGLYQGYVSATISLKRILMLARAVDGDDKHAPAPEAFAQTARQKHMLMSTRRNLPPMTVSLENITFGYKQGQVVFDGLSMQLKPGSMNALIGPSGAGKTTLFGLIAGLYRCQQGQITLDGAPLGSISPADRAAAISVVDQNPRMFARSLLENLTYLAPLAGPREVEEICKTLGLWDSVVLKLPKGLEEKLGEGSGVQISGGQRQRIVLARALLQRPQLLLLDEPTASLDTELRNQLMGIIERLKSRTTILMITHDLNIVDRMDQILFLAGGRIVESGTHQGLVGSRGAYYKFLKTSFSLTDEGMTSFMAVKKAGTAAPAPGVAPDNSLPEIPQVMRQLPLKRRVGFTPSARATFADEPAGGRGRAVILTEPDPRQRTPSKIRDVVEDPMARRKGKGHGSVDSDNAAAGTAAAAAAAGSSAPADPPAGQPPPADGNPTSVRVEAVEPGAAAATAAQRQPSQTTAARADDPSLFTGDSTAELPIAQWRHVRPRAREVDNRAFRSSLALFFDPTG